ncbi:hypothetical protein ACFVXW_38380 [Streptomyces sp. NPDC058251]|uniref:hypothetical protein n=2 Tax=Streptomyces TaxID=1883 RepID=UPI0036676FCC
MEPATQPRLDRFGQVGRPLHQSGNRVSVLPCIVTACSDGRPDFTTFSTPRGGVDVFGFSGVAGHSFSSSLGFLGTTGDHEVMLEDDTPTAL